jgi:hypothetical protein
VFTRACHAIPLHTLPHICLRFILILSCIYTCGIELLRNRDRSVIKVAACRLEANRRSPEQHSNSAQQITANRSS